MRPAILPAVLCAAVAAAPAAAAPRGQTVIFDEDVVNEPFSELDLFPCLGEEGMQDDEALIAGTETRHVTVTAAGTGAEGEPLAPYAVRATIQTRATVDPVLAGLPTYAGSFRTVFRERVGAAGSATSVVGQFVARAATGDALRFRFRLHVVVGADGSVRIERSVSDCAAS